MALAVTNLSKLQHELYREKHGFHKLSRNVQSSMVYDPTYNRRLTTYPDRYSRHLEQAEVLVKCPWGRARSYAGEAPVCLPESHRPKWEPPFLLQKGHRHFGSGVDPHPRGLPLQQFYDLTQLRRSKVRWNDELLPRPTTAAVQEGQIYLPFPKESPLSSHMSRQAMFPSPAPAERKYEGKITSPTPPPIIVSKAMGSFARREVVTPVFNSRTSSPLQHQVQPVAGFDWLRGCVAYLSPFPPHQEKRFSLSGSTATRRLQVVKTNHRVKWQTIGFQNTMSSTSLTGSTQVRPQQFDSTFKGYDAQTGN